MRRLLTEPLTPRDCIVLFVTGVPVGWVLWGWL